jgi:hypothetical protein
MLLSVQILEEECSECGSLIGAWYHQDHVSLACCCIQSIEVTHSEYERLLDRNFQYWWSGNYYRSSNICSPVKGFDDSLYRFITAY